MISNCTVARYMTEAIVLINAYVNRKQDAQGNAPTNDWATPNILKKFAQLIAIHGPNFSAMAPLMGKPARELKNLYHKCKANPGEATQY
jgi:hypothetical protein